MQTHISPERGYCGHDHHSLHANVNLAIGLLRHGISSQLTKHPDAVRIVAGDFNHVDLKFQVW